jgi:transposase
LKPIDRRQLLLRSVDVEELVGADHEVRAIWGFVGRLDLRGYYDQISAVEGHAGRSATDPRLLVSLWIYALSKGVSSAREIGRLCAHDPAYQWLTGMQPINYHTLSDFRVAHRESLEELFAQILGLLSMEGLVSLERVMHDGTKVRANASGDTFRREGKIRAHLELAKRQVQELAVCEQEVSPRIEKARQRVVRERQARLESALAEMGKLQDTKTRTKDKQRVRVSMTDPEARIMKQSDGGFAPSYNVQVSTDEGHRVVVGVGVSQAGSDYGELVGAVERIEEDLERDPDQVVVDGGFVSRENILAMSDRQVDLIGPLQDGRGQSAGQLHRRGVDPAFYPERFGYDAASDTYRCPRGKVLSYDSKEKRPGRTNYKYRVKAGDCQRCPAKHSCCPQGSRRTVVRGQDAPAVTAHLAKMQSEEAKEIYRKRGAVAEFPNAWIKSKIKLRQFRLQGRIKVQMEAIWACLTYNVQQWIRLRWRPKFAPCGG